jgi:hypothetical protein
MISHLRLFLCSMFISLAIGLLHAASETDVTIIKAEQVVIEGRTVTIIAEAKTFIRVFTPKDEHGDWKQEATTIDPHLAFFPVFMEILL